MTQRRPQVSDHAMVRYLERVIGIDVAGHRRDLEARLTQAVDLGASALISDGQRYVLIGEVLITVTPAHRDTRLPKMRPEDWEAEE